MSIDWNRAQKRPKKNQKVEGQILLDLRERINELEGNLVSMTEKFSSAKKNIGLISEQKFDIDIEITNLKSQLEAIFTENEEVRGELRFSSEKITELKQNLIFKDKTIETYKEDLKNRNQEIDHLKNRNEEHIKEKERLTEKIRILEIKMTKMESTPNILDKIKEAMLHKGFLSDQELYDIEEELNSKNTHQTQSYLKGL